MSWPAQEADDRGDTLKRYVGMAHEDDWRRASDRRVAGMPASMKGVGDLAPAMMTVMFKDKAPDLRDAPSSASLQWAVAIEEFRRRRHAEGFSAERVARDVGAVAKSCDRLRSFCESPIEHQLAPWLLCQSYGQWACGAPVTHIPKEDEVPPDADLMLIPQFAFARIRVDFALVAKIGPNTKIIAVECDGADFHQDARRDFRRDRYLAGWNIPTVRATGSEIARNPRHIAEIVARQVLDWGCELGLRP